jgi:hypothetical protein
MLDVKTESFFTILVTTSEQLSLISSQRVNTAEFLLSGQIPVPRYYHSFGQNSIHHLCNIGQ